MLKQIFEGRPNTGNITASYPNGYIRNANTLQNTAQKKQIWPKISNKRM